MINQPPVSPDNPFTVQEPGVTPPPPPQQQKTAMQQPPKKSPLKTILIVTGVLLFLAVAALALYIFAIKKDAPAPEPAANSQVIKVTENTDDVPDAVNTKTYKNEAMALTLGYPQEWKVTEAADGGFRVESPEFAYSDIHGTKIAGGNFRIYIRQGARPADSGYIGRSYAISPSEKLTYTKPLPGQRADTLLTPFGYDTPDNFAYFLVAGNFQLQKGDTLGPNYAKEADAFVIGGGYSSPANKDDLSMNMVPVAYYSTTEAYKQAFSILQSIQVQ